MLSVSISSGVNVTDSFTKTRTVTDFSNYKVVHKGSIVYNTMRMWQGASGVSNYEGYVSPAYTVANPLESVSSTFFSYLLKNESLIHQFKINSQGLCSDTWTLKFPEFGRMEIGIPSLAEQEKIGTFFRALDELIAAREAELEKLRQMKAALLDAMFPSDAPVARVTSATAHTPYDSSLDHTLQAWDIVPTEPSTPHTPRLRFRGFTDPWQRMRLGDVFDFEIPHNSLSRNDLTSEKREVRNVHYGDILITYGSVLDCNVDMIPYIKDESYQPTTNALLKDGDIIFADTAEDNTAGKAVEIRQVQENLIVAGLHTIVARPMDCFAPCFLGYGLNSNAFRKQTNPILQGTKVLSISKGFLSDTYLYYPSTLSEQKQIGTFFRSQDEGIATATEQIDKLKRIKQACLKQMFV